MTALPRLLTIMGSGETSPTMVKTHRELLARLGPSPVPAVVLDTPFGFQANADELVAKAVEYFRVSVGAAIEPVAWRRAEGVVAVESALARLRGAAYVFAGPGSPSYALRQWSGGPVPGLLAEKLRGGGALTFASAAALTLGAATVPVYEIYKVGADPVWLEGLDLLGVATGLRAAVVPHYDNAEGGTHDTRFCYLGESRLAALEPELPEDAFVLGVDEHTALVLDLDAGTATVSGRGGVTVRRDGRSSVVPAGSVVAIDELRALATGGGPGAAAGAPGEAATGAPGAPGDDGADATTGSPLLDEVAAAEATFASALGERDVDAAVAAVLELDEVLLDWSRDSLQSDHLDRGRSVLRSLVLRLGEVARTGAQDPAEVVGPFVEAVLAARSAARTSGDYATADDLRDRLVAAGVEVRDGPEGTGWALVP